MIQRFANQQSHEPAASREPRRALPRRAASALGATLLVLGALAAQAGAQSPAGMQRAQAQPAPAAPAEGQPGQAPVIQEFKDWALQCNPQEADTCYVVHTVFTAETKQPILQFVVGRFGSDKVLGALVFAPLGIRLPPGLTVQVDDKGQQRFPFERCTNKGCQAQVKMDEALLTAFKSGKGGEVTFHDAADRAVAVAFSLQGFSAAYGKLP